MIVDFSDQDSGYYCPLIISAMASYFHRFFLTASICLAFGSASAQTPAEYVNTTIGTKLDGFKSGYCVPGATRPFGMTQFSTPIVQKGIGFIINQVNAGCGHMGNFPLLAFKGSLAASPGRMMGGKIPISEERGHAGYYSAVVDRNIKAEFTSTCRTGISRFTAPDGSDKVTFLIGGGIASSRIERAAIVVTGPHSLEGFADGGNFCGRKTPYTIYFVAEFDKDATETGIWNGDKLVPGGRFGEGENSGAYFTFSNISGKPIQYKIGVSYGSVENARENLKAENPGWSFDSVRSDAEKEWNALLSKIEVEGRDEARKIQFYSHLYHVFMGPNTFNDVNGEYPGSDFAVHQAPQGRTVYANFSNWDTYRTQIQMLALIVPDVASDIAVSHRLFAEQAGGAFPRWSMANIETGIMQGEPSTLLVANAWAFGARQFDPEPLFRIMRRGATVPGLKCQEWEVRPNLKEYMEKGYTNASLQLEYTSADFALSRFAIDACNEAFSQWEFEERARSWKNLYNPETGWLQCKDAEGNWRPFSNDWADYCEASYKTYFWMVPYNLKGLIDIMGGKEAAEKRLDELFRAVDASPFEDWFPGGNEPGFQIPWTYNWVGRPDKTSETVRRILDELYFVDEGGVPGNDDMGTMGAWYVFACIGMYPMIPGVGGFTVNTPVFDRIALHLPGGTVNIKADTKSKPYTTSLKVNGESYDTAWIDLKTIENGGTIEYGTAAKPGAWGKTTAPPSFE